MATVYCEFCGTPIDKKISTPERLVNWIHGAAKDVVRCNKHRKTSKLHKTCRTFDPLTGQPK